MSELSKARPFQCGLLFIICLLGLKMWRALGPYHDLKTQARVQLGVFVLSSTVRKMRELQLSLNQTQKVRLQRALEKLESLSSKANSNASVTVADSIPVNYEDGLLKYLSSLCL